MDFLSGYSVIIYSDSFLVNLESKDVERTPEEMTDEPEAKKQR